MSHFGKPLDVSLEVVLGSGHESQTSKPEGEHGGLKKGHPTLFEPYLPRYMGYDLGSYPLVNDYITGKITIFHG